VNDRPDARELLEAVRRFLEKDVLAGARGAQRYQARVAVHALQMVERELGSEERHLAAEWQRLGALLGDDAETPTERAALREAIRERSEALVEKIRAGDADTGAWRREVIAHLRATSDAKLEVARGS